MHVGRPSMAILMRASRPVEETQTHFTSGVILLCAAPKKNFLGVRDLKSTWPLKQQEATCFETHLSKVLHVSDLSALCSLNVSVWNSTIEWSDLRLEHLFTYTPSLRFTRKLSWNCEVGGRTKWLGPPTWWKRHFWTTWQCSEHKNTCFPVWVLGECLVWACLVIILDGYLN